jgi:hypothetical protein
MIDVSPLALVAVMPVDGARTGGWLLPPQSAPSVIRPLPRQLLHWTG